jgi:CubicO group peptidase (beta-lactamase class C family)
LARIEAVTRDHIDAGLMPGAVMLVARRGKIAWTATLGSRDRAANEPMKPDSIFRIYSMTKPIVSVTAMSLVEEGKMQVSDPVSNFIPDMGKMKVGLEKTDGDGKKTLELVDPIREMTVQDLMRHTSGLIYGTRGNSLVNAAYIEAKIGDRGVSTEEFVARVAKLPLRFSPGTRWEYGVSTDVLGRVIEVVSGKSLGEAIAERVVKPLGMVDTAFYVEKDKLNRAAQPWQRPNAPAMTPRFDVAQKPRFESGGGGLTSTMDDYLRFTAMLANGGEFNGKRVLGKKTLEFMTADHTGLRPGRPPGLGFGLGFEVRSEEGEAALPGSVGEYGWAGNAGTLFWIDPKEQLIAIYMVQVSDPDRIMLRNQFRTMVQAAIIN